MKKIMIIICVILLCSLFGGYVLFRKYSYKSPVTKNRTNTMKQNDSQILNDDNAQKHVGSYDDKD